MLITAYQYKGILTPPNDTIRKLIVNSKDNNTKLYFIFNIKQFL